MKNDKRSYETPWGNRATFRSLFENSLDAILLTAQGGVIAAANPTACSMFGRTEDELCRIGLEGITDPHDQRHAVAMEMGRQSGKFKAELTYLRKDGTKFPADVSSVILSGKNPMAFVILRDISEHKQAEAALCESEQRYRMLFNKNPDGFFAVDTMGRFMVVNPTCQRMSGYTVPELLNMTFMEICAPDQVPKTLAVFAQTMATGACEPFESAIIRKDGTRVEVWVAGDPVLFEGKVISVHSTVRDITERKRTQEALLESEERHRRLAEELETLLEAAPAAVWIAHDPQCHKITGNRAAAEMLKCLTPLSSSQSKSEPAFSTCRSFKDGRELLPEEMPIKLAASGNPVSNFEFDFVFEDGSLRHMLGNATPTFDAAGNPRGSIGAFVDITEHKRAEEDRLILSKLESTGILAGGLAHDYNNLLNAILLNLDMVQSDLNSGQSLASHLEAARKTTVAALNLTKQFIPLARGGVTVRKPTSLEELINESVTVALSGSHLRSDISLARNLSGVEVDKDQIGQVLRNLLLNARDAMPSGGIISIRAKNINLTSKRNWGLAPGPYVQISVADKGCGIPPEILPKIFDPYFSTKQRGTHKGMGLGLTICRSVIQNHSGKMTVESKIGEGTTFHIYLSAFQGRIPCCVKEDKTALSTPSPALKVLVMDDESCMRIAVGAVLEGKGYQTELACDGQEAVNLYAAAKAQGRPFDVVLLDLTVRGGMGGSDAIRELLKIDTGVKAIVMSGYSEDPVVLKPEKYGFKAGMEKSFDVEQLIEMLVRVMKS